MFVKAGFQGLPDRTSDRFAGAGNMAGTVAARTSPADGGQAAATLESPCPPRCLQA